MTEIDRWWFAYCALGAALVIRAPSWGWAVFVVVLWGTAQAFHAWGIPAWKSRAEASEQAAGRAKWTERARADKTVVIPRAAPATVTEVTERIRVRGFDPTADPLGAKVTRVVVQGQVWTTDELLCEIRKTIARGRPSGGRRD